LGDGAIPHVVPQEGSIGANATPHDVDVLVWLVVMLDGKKIVQLRVHAMGSKDRLDYLQPVISKLFSWWYRDHEMTKWP
jgi:hypothetical protein